MKVAEKAWAKTFNGRKDGVHGLGKRFMAMHIIPHNTTRNFYASVFISPTMSDLKTLRLAVFRISSFQAFFYKLERNNSWSLKVNASKSMPIEESLLMSECVRIYWVIQLRILSVPNPILGLSMLSISETAFVSWYIQILVYLFVLNNICLLRFNL